MRVKEALRLDLKQRPHFAETVAAAPFYANCTLVDIIIVWLVSKCDNALQALCRDSFDKFLIYVQRTACDTACSCTDEHFSCLLVYQIAILFTGVVKVVFRFQQHIIQPPFLSVL